MPQQDGIFLARGPPNPNWPKEEPSKTPRSFLREQILALLKDSTTSVGEDLEALRQCLVHIRNRAPLGGIARECGLTLAGFLTDDALELYCDIKRGRHDLGYISNGLEDPGFRMGALVKISPCEPEVLKANSPHLRRYCATNGIAMTVQETPTISIQLDGVIYSEGFNRDTFVKTLDSLNACVDNFIPSPALGRGIFGEQVVGKPPDEHVVIGEDFHGDLGTLAQRRLWNAEGIHMYVCEAIEEHIPPRKHHRVRPEDNQSVPGGRANEVMESTDAADYRE